MDARSIVASALLGRRSIVRALRASAPDKLAAVSVPTAPVAAGSLVAGYLVARETRIRALGGVVLATAGLYLTRRWKKDAGATVAGALLGTYLAGFVVSHPLARKVGAWPSVLSVAAVNAGACNLLADRRRQRPER
jgi:hypothetical protein